MGLHHPLRPMKLLQHSNMALLGADFMSLFDETMFNWVRGRIRVGSEWVWMASSSDKKVPCKFDYDNTFSVDIDKFKSIVMNYLDIFAQNPKAPKECNGCDHEIVLSEDRVCADRVHRIPKKISQSSCYPGSRDVKTWDHHITVTPFSLTKKMGPKGL